MYLQAGYFLNGLAFPVSANSTRARAAGALLWGQSARRDRRRDLDHSQFGLQWLAVGLCSACARGRAGSGLLDSAVDRTADRVRPRAAAGGRHALYVQRREHADRKQRGTTLNDHAIITQFTVGF